MKAGVPAVILALVMRKAGCPPLVKTGDFGLRGGKGEHLRGALSLR